MRICALLAFNPTSFLIPLALVVFVQCKLQATLHDPIGVYIDLSAIAADTITTACLHDSKE